MKFINYFKKAYNNYENRKEERRIQEARAALNINKIQHWKNFNSAMKRKVNGKKLSKAHAKLIDQWSSCLTEGLYPYYNFNTLRSIPEIIAQGTGIPFSIVEDYFNPETWKTKKAKRTPGYPINLFSKVQNLLKKSAKENFREIKKLDQEVRFRI